jgi:hypothetical protein
MEGKYSIDQIKHYMELYGELRRVAFHPVVELETMEAVLERTNQIPEELRSD